MICLSVIVDLRAMQTVSCKVGLICVQVVVVEVRLGVVGVPAFYPLVLCLDVYLLSTA